MKSDLPFLFKAVVSLFCVLWISKEVLLPFTVGSLVSSNYMQLVVDCDAAMEAHWYGDQSAESELAAEVQLLDCHEYDKTRKLMLFSGLPEAYLAWLGLRALEIHQRPISEMVEDHKFRER